MSKTLLLLLLIITFGCSSQEVPKNIKNYQLGQQFDYTLNDQHGNLTKLTNDIRYVLLAFEMDLAKQVNQYLTKQPADFLAKNHASYIVDVSTMPGFVMKLFAGPKMRRYHFPILLAEDEDFKSFFPKQADMLTVFKIDQNSKILSIDFKPDLNFLLLENDPENKAE